MTSTKKDKNQQIQVFVRIRPLNKQEGNHNIIEVKNNKELHVKHHSSFKSYNYDRIFGPYSKQLEVYKMVAEPMVKEVIAGYNCTVLAYGQTGTGKTYTMAGKHASETSHSNTKPSWLEDEYSGIIPRTLAHMFDELRVQQLEYTVRVSFLELYNEELFDLLSPCEDAVKLKLYDDNMKKGSVIVHNLTEVTVNSKSEVFSILEKGAYKRKTAPTLMNAQSSRSHTVFCIIVHTKETAVDGEDLLKTGKLYLVDLAGSENIKQSGATEIRAREAFSINQSLLTLGRCIAKLFERSAHIPYRESKLTRLLQDSLGGRTKTTLIATVSPAHCNVDETINTLEYASRAKNITNKPEINQRMSKNALLKEYTEEIERLRKDLMANRTGRGIFLDEENYSSLIRERDNQKDEIAEKITMIRILQEQMSDKEHLCEELKISLEEQQKEVELKICTISTLEGQLEKASEEINSLQQENELKQFIVEKYSETEEQLKLTAQELLKVADNTTYDTRKLHDKLDILTELNKQNKELYEKQIHEFQSKMNDANSKLKVFQESEMLFHRNISGIIRNLEELTIRYKNKFFPAMDQLNSVITNVNQCGTETNFATESIKVSIEAVQANISDYINETNNHVYETLMMSIKPQIAKLCTCTQQQDSFVTKVIEDLKEILERNNMQVSEFITSFKNFIIETNASAAKQIEQQINLCCKIQQDIIKKHEVKVLQKKAIEEQYNIASMAIQQMKLLMDEYDKENNVNKESYLQQISTMKDHLFKYELDVKTNAENSDKIINNFNKSRKVMSLENKSILNCVESEKKDINLSLKQSKYDINQVTDEFLTFSQESFLKIDNNTKDQIQDIEHFVIEQMNEHITTLDETEDKLRKVNNELDSNSKMIIAEISDECGGLNDYLVARKKTTEDVSSLIRKDLEYCREGFYELRSSRLKEYKTTGETPRRKSYCYPRTLSETKPREKLLEEYRQVRSVSASRIANEIPEEPREILRCLSENNILKENNVEEKDTSLDVS